MGAQACGGNCNRHPNQLQPITPSTNLEFGEVKRSRRRSLQSLNKYRSASTISSICSPSSGPDTAKSSKSSVLSFLSPTKPLEENMYSSGDDDPYDLYRVDPESNQLKLDVHKMITEDEKSSIIFTPKGTVKAKPNLVRPGTDTPWQEHDIDEMMDDMKEQMQSLHGTSETSPLITSVEDIAVDLPLTRLTLESKEGEQSLSIDRETEREHVQEDQEQGETQKQKENQTKGKRARRSSTHSVYRQRSMDKWDENEISVTLDGMSKELTHLYKSSGRNLTDLDTPSMDRPASGADSSVER